MKMCACVTVLIDAQRVQASECKSKCMCGWWLLLVAVCVHSEGTARMSSSFCMYINHNLYTYQEEDAEVGQLSKEILHADWVGVKGEITAYALVELLHVLVHRGQLFILLPGMLGEAVRRTVKEKGERLWRIHISYTEKTHSKCAVISNICSQICWSVNKTSHCENMITFISFIAFKKPTYVKVKAKQNTG